MPSLVLARKFGFVVPSLVLVRKFRFVVPPLVLARKFRLVVPPLVLARKCRDNTLNHATNASFLNLPRSLFSNHHTTQCYVGRGSDFLRAGRSGDRMPVGARFSSPILTDRAAHPFSSTVSTRSFPWATRPGHGVDHPLSSSAEVKERVELYL